MSYSIASNYEPRLPPLTPPPPPSPSFLGEVVGSAHVPAAVRRVLHRRARHRAGLLAARHARRLLRQPRAGEGPPPPSPAPLSRHAALLCSRRKAAVFPCAIPPLLYACVEKPVLSLLSPWACWPFSKATACRRGVAPLLPAPLPLYAFVERPVCLLQCDIPSLLLPLGMLAVF